MGAKGGCGILTMVSSVRSSCVNRLCLTHDLASDVREQDLTISDIDGFPARSARTILPPSKD